MLKRIKTKVDLNSSQLTELKNTLIFELKIQIYNIYPIYRLTKKQTHIIYHDGLIARNSCE